MRILCSRALALRDVARVVGARGSATAAADASGEDCESDLMLDGEGEETRTVMVMDKEDPDDVPRLASPITYKSMERIWAELVLKKPWKRRK